MTLYIDDPDFQLHVGDALEVLQAMQAQSVHCCVTSPPYWGLRDYSTEGQLGLEPTPDQYVTNMVAVFREVRRVLRADGTLWLNIGDSYNAYNGGAGPGSKLSKIQTEARPRLESGYGLRFKGLKPKDLVGIPWRLAFALQADGWYLRSDIIWSKPNPMPESVTDRPTKAHEYLFLLTKSPRYFYDADAIREPHSPDGRLKTVHDHVTPNSHPNYDSVGNGNERWPNGGRNKRSVWEIATEAYPDAHFATFPQALVEPCIKAGTSEHGCCPVCGAPWEREIMASTGGKRTWHDHSDDLGKGQGQVKQGQKAWDTYVAPQTTGWKPSCNCVADRVSGRMGVAARPVDGNDVEGHAGTEQHLRPGSELRPTSPASVPCVVLDPFLGSGTTAQVARRLGRKSIGIELNPEYAQLAARRLQQLSLFAVETAEA